jgi:hypothetical protein
LKQVGKARLLFKNMVKKMIKLSQTKKYVLTALATSVLTACGGSSNNNEPLQPNTAPTHGGDIVASFAEKDAFKVIHLLGTPEGNSSGTGVAVDADGDILRIVNVQTNLDDMTGFEMTGPRLGVRPLAIAPNLDSGQTLVLEVQYEITDGQASVNRTATISIEGEDFTPEFEANVSEVLSKFADITTVDLLFGVEDKDEEPLNVSEVAIPSDAPAGLFSLEGSLLTIDVPSVADSIEIGDSLTFDITYFVQDHNNSLPRTMTIDIRGVRIEPVPPIVNGPQTAETNTSGERVSIALTSEPAIVEENGDALSVDFATLVPRGDEPAFSFGESDIDQSVVVFDPMIFAPHLEDGERKTFIYDYDLTDGEFTVQASVEISVTDDGSEQSLANGNFEVGIDGWSASANGVNVASGASGTIDVEGNNYLDFATPDTVRTNLGELEEGATYVIEGRIGHPDPWGGATIITVFGDAPDEDGVLQGDAILTQVQAYGHGVPDRTWSAIFEATTNAYITVEGEQAIDMDDFRLYKVDFDQANNLLSENNSTFDNGIGDWILGGDAEYIADGIGGTGSLYSGGAGDARHILPLGNGVIKNGKRYLITMDVHREIDDGAHTFRVSVLDSNEPSNETALVGNAFRGVYWLRQTQQSFAAVLDPTRYSNVTDWDTRDISLHIGTNVWSQGNRYTVDNIRLIELP